jgi:hypothetical protein
MDPLSFFGVVATIGHLIRRATEFASGVQAADRSMRRIIRELESLRNVINLLNESLDEANTPRPPNLDGIIRLFHKSIRKLGRKVENYNLKRLRDRLGYVWSGKEDMAAVLDELRGHGVILSLALNSLIL